MKMLSAHIGQGATEYLVLLAVVLIVALVSVALLGFFPGMASDAQITQSQMYWKSAQPVSIVESGAVYYMPNGYTYPYLRLRNSGAYPIRVTGIIGSDGGKTTRFWNNNMGAIVYISDYFYLGPGEEKYFSPSWLFNTVNDWRFGATNGATGDYFWVGVASSNCQNSSASPGTLDYKSFGFEYIEYLDNNQQITKRQIGKELAIKCLPAQ